LTPLGTTKSCSAPVALKVTVATQRPVVLHEGAHALPSQRAAQSAQKAPAAPQAATEVPGWHVMPSQQPPLQVRPPTQLDEHVRLAGSHASTSGHGGEQDDFASGSASCGESEGRSARLSPSVSRPSSRLSRAASWPSWRPASTFPSDPASASR
jgi:hypothetical protein